MYHPLPHDWLLATNKIEVEFSNGADIKTIHGSGFWTRLASDLPVTFVTNRHVADLVYKEPKYQHDGYTTSSIRVVNFNRETGNPQHLKMVGATIRVHKNPRIDLALLSFQLTREGQNWGVLRIDPSLFADADSLMEEIEWGAMVSFCSFQPWRDVQSDRPILRTGILASDPTRAFVSPDAKNDHIHLLEAFSFAGSSGSPVFANAKGIKTGPTLTGGGFRRARLLGIMAGHIQNERWDSGAPFKTHTGLSYCHRADLLMSMMRGEEPLTRTEFRAEA